ncbi:MAG: hypothetical protein IJA55_00190 [Clostridia bacterium]|nr:hypothetical protein [Clostridia bacterium]
MSIKGSKKLSKKKTNKPSSAPVNAPGATARELTRAEKTAQAREAAAKRNAQKLTPSKRQTDNKSRAQKTAEARNSVAKAKAAKGSPSHPNGTQRPSSKPTARRTLSSRPQAKKEQQANSRQEINRKINTQTRTRRREEKTNKKVSGSVKNLEIKRRSKAINHSFRIKKKSHGVTRLLLSRLIMFFVTFALMFSATAGLFTLSLKSGKISSDKEYILQLGEDIPEGTEHTIPEKDKPKYLEIPKECAVRYGKLYFPVSALADMCQLTVTGTHKDLRYLPRESEGHSMRFVVGTDIAYVNGAKVRMISPSFLHSEKLYVPLDFMLKYSKGLSIETDEVNRKITVYKYREGYDAATDSDIFSTLKFNLCVTSPLPNVEEPPEEEENKSE